MIQFVIGVKSGSVIFQLLGLLMSTISTGLYLNLHFFRIISADFDRLMSWPIKEVNLIESASKLSTILSLLLLIINGFISYLFIDIAHIIKLIVCYIFAIGVTNNLYLFAGIHENKRFDYSLSQFNAKGIMVSNPFLNTAISLLCLFFLSMLFFIDYYNEMNNLYSIVIMSLGIFGIIFKSYIRNKLNLLLKSKLYKMKSGFRTS
jgi:hypothetical protein